MRSSFLFRVYYQRKLSFLLMTRSSLLSALSVFFYFFPKKHLTNKYEYVKLAAQLICYVTN